ncbi:MAG: hypothetical protein JSS58_04940 [Proteobacteria bacterium]|nr:hypothetical protein [Pseudomonadota bacterium]
MSISTILMLCATLFACGGGGGGGGGGNSTTPSSTTTTVTTTTTTTMPPAAGAPIVLYTDLVSGPTSGGENNRGAYLTIFGKNFGNTGLGTTTKVFIGSAEVASYRALSASKVYDKIGIQQIAVQVGALGGAAQGVALPIKVSVNGVDSNTNVSFMPNPGRLLYVDNVAGTGAIVLMGYPGEDTYIRGTIAGGMTGGCVSGINGQSFTGMGQWAVITNLRMDCEGYDGPISQEIYGHNWRVINNDLSASTAPRTGPNVPRMAGITGNGNNAVWYGNHIHDIQGSAQECHGIYIDGDGSYDIAYNHIHDIRDGNGFQVYVNGGNGSTEANNVSLHHNFIHDVSKHGINIGDGMRNDLKIWNNITYNAQYAALRFNTNTLNGAQIFHNTFYNTNLASNVFYGALTNDWNLPAGSMDVENNIFYVASGTPYNSGSVSVLAGNGTFKRNLWFNGTGSTAIDSLPVTADPKFIAAGSDFHLQPASPAIGIGSTAAAVTTLVTNDFDLKPRGPAMNLGAFQ